MQNNRKPDIVCLIQEQSYDKLSNKKTLVSQFSATSAVQLLAAAPFFLGAASVPSLKLLLNLLGTWRRYLILPVPVVFLLMAFTLQLSVFQISRKNQSSQNYISEELSRFYQTSSMKTARDLLHQAAAAAVCSQEPSRLRACFWGASSSWSFSQNLQLPQTVQIKCKHTMIIYLTTTS